MINKFMYVKKDKRGKTMTNNKVVLVSDASISEGMINGINEYISQVIPLINLTKPVHITLIDTFSRYDESIKISIDPKAYNVEILNNDECLFNIFYAIFYADTSKGMRYGMSLRGVYLQAVGAAVAFLQRYELQEQIPLMDILPLHIQHMLQFDNDESDEPVISFGQELYKGEISQNINYACEKYGM